MGEVQALVGRKMLALTLLRIAGPSPNEKSNWL